MKDRYVPVDYATVESIKVKRYRADYRLSAGTTAHGVRRPLGFLLDAHRVPVVNFDHDQEDRNLP
jgi:hypothetical protein